MEYAQWAQNDKLALVAYRLRRWPNIKPTLAQHGRFSELLGSILIVFVRSNAWKDKQKIKEKNGIAVTCSIEYAYSVNSNRPDTRRWSNGGWMLGQRRIRWTNIQPALDQCLEFVGK